MDFDIFEDNMVQYRYKVLRPMQIMETNCTVHMRGGKIMNKIERLLVFGDIHGNWERFMDVYQKVNVNPENDLVVFLGDYLDRGKNPVPVMDWVLEHFGTKNMIFLRGNHEQMFYESLRTEGQDAGMVDYRISSPKALWFAEGSGGFETYACTGVVSWFQTAMVESGESRAHGYGQFFGKWPYILCEFADTGSLAVGLREGC